MWVRELTRSQLEELKDKFSFGWIARMKMPRFPMMQWKTSGMQRIFQIVSSLITTKEYALWKMIFSAHVGDKEEIFMEKKCDWIITILDSDAETTTIKRFNGTKNEAKKLLFQLSKEDSEGEEIYDIAETVDDVDEISDAEVEVIGRRCDLISTLF